MPGAIGLCESTVLNSAAFKVLAPIGVLLTHLQLYKEPFASHHSSAGLDGGKTLL